jgi:hypothetical protein
MRVGTEVWVQVINTGRRGDSERFNGPLNQVIPLIVAWLIKVTMGGHLRVVFARNETELELAIRAKQSNDEKQEDLMSELGLTLAGLGINLTDTEESA